MKRISALICFLLTAGFASTTLAQTAPAAPAAGPTKIAIIAFQSAVAHTNEGQRALSALSTKYEPTQQHLKALSDEVDSLKKQLQTDGDKLSPQEKASRTQTIDTKDKQLQLEAEDAQTRYQNDVQNTFAGVADKVGKVMLTYVENNGYTLLLDISSQQQGNTTVMWFTPSTDITEAVVTAYNATTPSITAPAPSAPAPTHSAAPAARPAAPRPATR
jgi:outer membrane protein